MRQDVIHVSKKAPTHSLGPPVVSWSQGPAMVLGYMRNSHSLGPGFESQAKIYAIFFSTQLNYFYSLCAIGHFVSHFSVTLTTTLDIPPIALLFSGPRPSSLYNKNFTWASREDTAKDKDVCWCTSSSACKEECYKADTVCMEVSTLVHPFINHLFQICKIVRQPCSMQANNNTAVL